MKSPAIDFSRHLSLQIGALKMFGVWFFIPYSYKTGRFWFSVLNKIFLGIFVFIIPTASQFMYVVKLIQSDNIEIQEVAGTINLVLTELQGTVRLLDMYLRRHKLMELSDELMNKEFQWHEKPLKEILEKGITLSRRLFCGMIVCCFTDVIVQVIVVPAVQNFKVLPLKMNLIFIDLYDERYFNHVFIYQIIYKPTLVTSFIAIQTMSWAAMSFAISQLDVLIYNFENMKEVVKTTAVVRQCDENEAFKEIFKRNVLHHCAIIRFVNKIQDTFSFQLFAVQIMNIGILGTTGVQIFSIESPLKNPTEVFWVLAYLTIFIGFLFADCYFGNAVTDKSRHVATVVFACPWIDLPTNFKRNLVIFIAKTQRPVVISAASYIPVSLETFTKVMNWTYKGFAVLNQMTK